MCIICTEIIRKYTKAGFVSISKFDQHIVENI